MFEATIPLRGAGGEPVDLRRTLASHGVAELPPMDIDHTTSSFRVTLPVGSGARTVTVAPRGRATLALTAPGRTPTAAQRDRLIRDVRTILHLDADLTPFYDLVGDDPDLAWVATGAGRMIRSRTVFEEVIKTICTTNCAWGGTVRMVNAIVGHLGVPAPGAPAEGPLGRAFPTPEAMASAGEDFYREVARAGYRAASFLRTAELVADGELDLESLDPARPDAPDDATARERLLSVPGVGPYAAAHVMMMIGRSRDLILDSWTRPTYATLTGAKKVPADRTIIRRFARYGPYAGLAFWLTCTANWVED